MNYEKELRELFFMQQIYANLFSVTNKIQIYGDKALEDMTLRQFMAVLAVMHLSPEEATINRIAAKMGTTKQNANVMVASLVKKGVVKVEKSKTDKRAVNVTVTEAGQKVMDRNGFHGNLLMADVFADFDEVELATLFSLLKRLNGFDGKVQDDYEEAVAGEFDPSSASEKELALLAEFAEKRKNPTRKGNQKHENRGDSPEGSL